MLFKRSRAKRYQRETSQELEKLSIGKGKISIPSLDPASFNYRPVGSENLLAIQNLKMGRLLITDQALVFESPNGNNRHSWNSIADVDFLLNGYRVHKRTGRPIDYIWNKFDARFSAILEALL